MCACTMCRTYFFFVRLILLSSSATCPSSDVSNRSTIEAMVNRSRLHESDDKIAANAFAMDTSSASFSSCDDVFVVVVVLILRTTTMRVCDDSLLSLVALFCESFRFINNVSSSIGKMSRLEIMRHFWLCTR